MKSKPIMTRDEILRVEKRYDELALRVINIPPPIDDSVFEEVAEFIENWRMKRLREGHYEITFSKKISPKKREVGEFWSAKTWSPELRTEVLKAAEEGGYDRIQVIYSAFIGSYDVEEILFDSPLVPDLSNIREEHGGEFHLAAYDQMGTLLNLKFVDRAEIEQPTDLLDALREVGEKTDDVSYIEIAYVKLIEDIRL